MNNFGAIIRKTNMALTKILLVKKRLLLLKLLNQTENKNGRKKKRFWVRKLYAERLQKGEFHLFVRDLRLHDHEYFFKYFRMSPTVLEELLSFVSPMRDPIFPSERLAVTLRYLVTGDAQCTGAASYRISPSAVSRIITETCDAIWTSLKRMHYLDCPSNVSKWKSVAQEFKSKWDFPHVVGALDGKLLVIQAPHNSGFAYVNYKKMHSILLLAVCNAKYEFTMVDIGSVYNNSHLGFAIENNTLNLPDPNVAGSNPENKLPYVFVADDAFGLKCHMTKSYPDHNIPLDERIFNYRCFRARRIIDNAFGIATSRFRIFGRPINANTEKVILITKTVVSLHNFLMKKRANQSENYSYCPQSYVDQVSQSGVVPGDWRKEEAVCGGLLSIQKLGSNNYPKSAKEVRDRFKNYFCSPEGAVEWQFEKFTRTYNQ